MSRVHILATVRKEELFPYTMLVFKTLRLGFPTADVVVWLNSMNPMGEHSKAIVGACNAIGANTRMCDTIHHQWIRMLLDEAEEPFWICDTDLVFYGDMEVQPFNGPLAGWRIPEFRDEFSGAITRARLHTSLLYMDPKKIEEALEEYTGRLFETPFTPQINLIDPVVIPFKGKAYFHDTCSLLYHAVGGQTFTDEQKAKYFHMNFGTISDIVLPRLRYPADMQQARDWVLADPERGRDLWRVQENYYALRPV